MKDLGTKELMTKHLILKVPTMKEQKKLYDILMIPEVNKYYLSINKKYKNNLLSWENQKQFYENKITTALSKDRYEWSIFLKETGECIGQINAHNRNDLSNDIKDVGWYIEPKYQGNGYASEAARAMLNYMLYEVGISGIITSAAILNVASWRIMEKLGFVREKDTKFNKYTFVDESVESYVYKINSEQYTKYNN